MNICRWWSVSVLGEIHLSPKSQRHRIRSAAHNWPNQEQIYTQNFCSNLSIIPSPPSSLQVENYSFCLRVSQCQYIFYLILEALEEKRADERKCGHVHMCSRIFKCTSILFFSFSRFKRSHVDFSFFQSDEKKKNNNIEFILFDSSQYYVLY